MFIQPYRSSTLGMSRTITLQLPYTCYSWTWDIQAYLTQHKVTCSKKMLERRAVTLERETRPLAFIEYEATLDLRERDPMLTQTLSLSL